MNKTFRLYGIIFILVMLLLVLLEMGKTERTDWRKNFDVTKKSPFGLYIFDNEAGHLLKGKLKRTQLSPYDYYSATNRFPQNILVVQSELDIESWKKILTNVQNGSDALFISEEFPAAVMDSLGFRIRTSSLRYDNVLKLTDRKFKRDSLILDKFADGRGFSSFGDEASVLGTAAFDGGKLNFIKIPFGKGNLYLHSQPLFITNYYLLRPGNEKYVQDVFSYLPDRETVWFMNTTGDAAESASPLRFILSKPALKYAWWLFLAGLVLFVIFNAKRKQRVIPVIEPLKNRSVEFVKSISNLYMQEGDFHDMMAKKAQYFLNRVRQDLLLDTQNLDEKFIYALQLKSGQPEQKIPEAVNLLQKAQDPYAAVTKEDLITMNKLLDEILR